MGKLILEGIAATGFIMVGYYFMFFHRRVLKKWELALMLAGYTAMAAICYVALYNAVSSM